MRIACVLIPHFALQVEVRRHPELRRQPVVLGASIGSRRTVLDASPGLRGVTPGMPLQEALAGCKKATLLEADPPAYRQACERVLDALESCSPVIEEGGLGTAYLDLQGMAALYGGEARLATAILQAVPAGFLPKLGIADGKFPAYVAASKASYPRAFQAPEETASFLAGVPVHMLPVSWEMTSRLRGFGLETLGQVVQVGIGPLQAEFGQEGRLAWELASGIDRRPLVPRRVEETVVEEVGFPAPTIHLGTILMAAETLLGRAFSHPVLRGRYVRVALVEGEIFRRAPFHKRVPFKEPVGSRTRAYEVMKASLASVTIPGPLESLRLTLSELTGESGQQGSFFSEVRRRQQLYEGLAQLKAQMGREPPVYTMREVEPWSRIPERRYALVPFAP